jgi:RNA polymerase sigma-70 factor (ECF subfamily)
MAGDADAFSELAAAANRSLQRSAFLVLCEAGPAEDAVQDALIAAWRGVRGLRDPDRFDAWLRRLTVRAALQVARAERRRSTAVRVQWCPPAWSAASVDDEQDRVAMRDEVARAFRRLTAGERAVLFVRYTFDLPLSDAAEMLGVPLGTVKSRLSHAHRALRAGLEAEERRGQVQQAGE